MDVAISNIEELENFIVTDESESESPIFGRLQFVPEPDYDNLEFINGIGLKQLKSLRHHIFFFNGDDIYVIKYSILTHPFLDEGNCDKLNNQVLVNQEIISILLKLKRFNLHFDTPFIVQLDVANLPLYLTIPKYHKDFLSAFCLGNLLRSYSGLRPKYTLLEYRDDKCLTATVQGSEIYPKTVRFCANKGTVLLLENINQSHSTSFVDISLPYREIGNSIIRKTMAEREITPDKLHMVNKEIYRTLITPITPEKISEMISMYGENIEILNKTMFSQDIDDIVEIERLPPVDIISITDYRPERYEIGGSKKEKQKNKKK